MRLISEMSHDEKIKLTTADIKNMCNYICAVEGIKILPHPVEPKKPEIKPDLPCFSLGEFYSTRREPLDEISALFAKHKDELRIAHYEWTIGSEFKTLRPHTYQIDPMLKVEHAKVYTQETYDSFSAEMRRYTDAKKSYDKDLVEFEKNQKERAAQVDWVWDEYNNAMHDERQFETMKSRLIEYIGLANGDRTMAMQFLKKAYQINQTIESRLESL